MLGVGVLAAADYRVLVLNQPEAEPMGRFGAVALAVNVAAAAVLVLHRTGNANFRGGWPSPWSTATYRSASSP